MRVLVTGGAGFIGSAVCRLLARRRNNLVVNVDKLTYAASPESLSEIDQLPNYRFYQVDICDRPALGRILRAERITGIIHLAAESHVDRSITGPADFIRTNIEGTYALLEASREYWSKLAGAEQDCFRFVHVSTDEVYGSLALGHPAFTEETPYEPRSPYAASKAAADHLALAWQHTYGLPVVVTNCTNNYGPYHFPEKLVPLVLLNALEEKPLPLYGHGDNVRDWLHVEDHARALELVLAKGRPGEKYNIGARSERTNLQVVTTICETLDLLRPRPGGGRYADLIAFVADRPGHDFRYAIEPIKIEQKLGWRAEESFESGLRKTICWYLDNEWWWRPIRERRYNGERLGLLEERYGPAKAAGVEG